MKKLFAATVLISALAMPRLLATQMSTVDGYGPYQTGLGGEFTFYSTDLSSTIANYAPSTMDQYGSSQPNFQTFCVEGSEIVQPNSTYNVVLNDHSVASDDPLTAGAALLYSEFAQGNLAGYNYSGGYGAAGARYGQTGSSADLLQNAIWAFFGGQEGQDLATLYNGGVYAGGNVFVIDAVNALGGLAAADSAVAGGTDGVYVLNMFNSDGSNAQDMLIWTVPDGGTTILLLGLGFLAIAFTPRRFAVA